jgi:hypothetical protein
VTEGAEKKLLRALAAVSAALDRIDSPSMIIGGIAVIVRGAARATLDIDATVWAGDGSLEGVLKAMKSKSIIPRIAGALAFARQNQVLLLVHRPTGTPIDVSMASLDFEREALARATLEDVGGISVRVAAPEDLVVLKAVAWRDRDRSDIERLLVLHRLEIDLDRVRRLVKAFAHIIDEPNRVEEFEQLVERARNSSRERHLPGRLKTTPPRKRPRQRKKARKSRSHTKPSR